MGSDRRVKRPRLDRSRPIRSWSHVLGAPGESAAAEPRVAADAPPRARLEEVISRSVELGYRVVDEYVQQGQRAAQQLSAGRLTGETVASEVQDLGGRIARYASDFFAAWVELLELAAAGSAARQPPAPAGDAARPSGAPAVPAPASARPPADPAPGPAPATRVRLEVVTSRPAEVAMDLHLERTTGPLRAHELRSADPRKPRLGDVTVHADAADRVAVIGIRIPPTHPAGAYEGLVLDAATNRPVGSLRVVLKPPPAKPRRSRKGVE